LAEITSAREEPRLVESVYRAVTALRADPRFADEALPPDAYLAALDSVAPAQPAERREPLGRREPKS
jgi:hypothetical protein